MTELDVNVTENIESDSTYDHEIKGFINSVSDSARRLGWERKLLDLTLRNSMLNLKPGKTILQIREPEIESIITHIKKNTFNSIIGIEDNEKDNLEQLKNLYRAARLSIEESGANSLFISLGSLKWFDGNDPRKHIAPLLFIPMSISRQKAMTFEVRLRDEESLLNVTLIEMLRQMFGIKFPEFDVLPEREDGLPDWESIFKILNSQIADINRHQKEEFKWEIQTQSYIGIFSFKKFLLWHDIHAYPDTIERHPIIKGFIDKHYDKAKSHPSREDIELEEHCLTNLMLPVDYDSSQLVAVAETHAGRSFVLHGPPGTGKSQTITNMIADAIFCGKRVLFVAEKQAALDVVKSRLDKIGLTPYCLELHSNKTDKRTFITQLENSNIDLLAQGKRKQGIRNFKEEATFLAESIRYLLDIIKAIHGIREHEQSLYDIICTYLETGYKELNFKYEDIKHLSPGEIESLCNEYESLDLISEIIGFHPCKSSLLGLYPTENTAANQKELTDTLSKMNERILRARKKSSSIFNRWFFHRTPEEILQKDEFWLRLKGLAKIEGSESLDLENLEQQVCRWNSAIDELRKWYKFAEKVNAISSYNLPVSFDYYLKGNDGIQTAKAVHSAYYRSKAAGIIDNELSLRGFIGKLHEKEVEKYRTRSVNFQNLRCRVLLEGLENRMRSYNLSTEEEKELVLLRHRIGTKGRRIPLRRIISESSSILPKIFPCALMSPLSVAQYLAMKPNMFDIVIFDEASQMETPDAIGTIARGRNLVVVGDAKQLPPTRFFTSTTESGEEMEESEDADSILEDCITLGLPSYYLSRHYRSRHESLISFSNRHFYDERLLTFPSFNDEEKKVSFIDPCGIYDYGKSRTNRKEAEAVVKKIIELITTSETAPSIGIVAFSRAQSNLIDDILSAKLVNNKNLLVKLEEAKEPLFIKNLENVQGDERDIIIFSIGYGPDKNGKVSLNFGPINKSGGERRLNVAVSRAREEMIVFSSLRAQHIPEEGIVSSGVKALRNFLAYANGEEEIKGKGKVAYEDNIAENIAKKLREKGLSVNTKIGRSSFKIDLAVVDPSNPDKYILGIVIDGKDYYRLPTIRDREITVPNVLSSLGWNIKRVWIIDWLEDPDSVTENILKEFNNLIGKEI